MKRLTVEEVRALQVGEQVFINGETPAGIRHIECTVARRGTGDKFLTFRVKGKLKWFSIRDYPGTYFILSD